MTSRSRIVFAIAVTQTVLVSVRHFVFGGLNEWDVVGLAVIWAVTFFFARRLESEFKIKENEIERISKTLQETAKERDVQRQKMAESAKLSALGEMSAGIAHEINNPLMIIEGNTDYLEHLCEDVPEERKIKIKERLERIRKTVQRIAKIVHGLRRFSRSGEGDAKQSISIGEFLEETANLCNQKFVDGGIQLRLGEIPDVSVPVREVQLSQVIINLLSNAYDAIEALPERWVQIDVEKTDYGTIKIRVTDSGKGISAQLQRRIMEPFFTTKEIGKGTGLGLSISQGIVTDHNGWLYVDGTHANTSFVVELPMEITLETSARSG